MTQRRRTLTERSVKALTTTEKRGRHVYDVHLKGFGCTVYPEGRKVFWLVYADPRGGRTESGRPARRRLHLGMHGVVTVAEARADALVALGEVRKGRDPAEDRKRRRGVPTFSEWVTEYLAGVRLRKKQPQDDVRYLARACERWGQRPLDAIAPEDVARLVQNIAEEHPTAANRCLASVAACLQSAWRMDKVPSNPARKVKRFSENPPRQRVLTDDELHRVLRALSVWPDPWERAAFTLLVETGARLSEVLRARWSDLDLDAGEWRIPSSKADRPQLILLAGSTVAMLRRLPPHLGELVVPGRSHVDKPRSNLRHVWAALRVAAKVPDVTVHDIRRTFGKAVARAAGLHIASKMLRHSDIRVTEAVYAPLGVEVLRAAAEQHATHVDNVLKMHPRKKLAS